MIKQTIFLIVTSLAVIYGLVFTLKYFGWPSISDRKNKIMRAIRTGFSSTVLIIGLMLMYFYWSQPEAFWSQWTVATIIGAFLFFVIPIYCAMTIGSYVQFSIWEKTQPIMTDRLRKIVEDTTKDDNKTK